MKKDYILAAIMILLGGIVLGLLAGVVIEYIQYQQMLAFERELDEAVRRTKAIYGGN